MYTTIRVEHQHDNPYANIILFNDLRLLCPKFHPTRRTLTATIYFTRSFSIIKSHILLSYNSLYHVLCIPVMQIFFVPRPCMSKNNMYIFTHTKVYYNPISWDGSPDVNKKYT